MTEHVGETWQMNGTQVSAFDEVITVKDAEVEQLKARVSELEARALPVAHISGLVLHHSAVHTTASERRR